MKYELSNICDFVNERIPISELNLHNYISTENMLQNRGGIVDATNLPSIAQVCGYKSGDILVSNIRPYFKKVWYARTSGGCSNDVLVFRAKDNIDSRFLYYVLSDDAFFTYATSTSKGTKMPRGDKSSIMNYHVSNFDNVTQKKIAGILRTIDEKIEVNGNINQNLEEQASTLIEDYFYCTQAHSKLSNLMNFENGFPFSSKSYLSEGRYRIVTIKNVQDGKIDMSGAACVNILPPKIKEGCLLKIGDVLLSLTGNVGRVGIVCEQNLLLNQRVAKVTPYDATMLPFLYFTLRQPNMKKQMEIIAKGTAQLNLSPVEALQLDIPYKDVSAQRMSETLSPMYRTITYNNQENITLEALREAILPKLMSGELDVSELDI